MSSDAIASAKLVRALLALFGVAAAALPIALGNCSSEALMGPGVWNYHIRLCGPPFRYITREEMCGCGNGSRSSNRFMTYHDIRARCERRLNGLRHTP